MSKKIKFKTEIKQLSVDKLIEKIGFLKKELFNLRFQKALGELKNTSRFSATKREIAVIKTELNFRKR